MALDEQRRKSDTMTTTEIAEITQHAGHADIIRESLDGSKTME